MLNIKKYEKEDRERVLDDIAYHCDNLEDVMNKTIENTSSITNYYYPYDSEDEELEIIHQLLTQIEITAVRVRKLAQIKREKVWGIKEKLPEYEEE